MSLTINIKANKNDQLLYELRETIFTLHIAEMPLFLSDVAYLSITNIQQLFKGCTHIVRFYRLDTIRKSIMTHGLGLAEIQMTLSN